MKVLVEKTLEGKYIRANIGNDGSMGICWVAIPKTADQFQEVIEELRFIRKELWPSYVDCPSIIKIVDLRAPQQHKGKVKWFNDAKGFGFIETDETPPRQVFVHFTSIRAKEGSFRTLAEGDKVTFEVIDGPKGFTAMNVRPE